MLLTVKHGKFLSKQKWLSDTTWYLAGGTALALQEGHRASLDLDFFTTSQVNDLKIEEIVKKSAGVLQATVYTKKKISGLFTYQLQFPDGILKIDFNEYAFPLIELSTVQFRSLKIDSFYDISVNKAYAITGRFQIRDFIDLYFILKKKEFTLEQLLERIPDKFGPQIDPANYASQLLRVHDLSRAYPYMLVPFHFNEMVDFFTKEAQRIAEKHLFQR